MQSHSVMFNSATLWTVARQALLSMGFTRQGYWCGLPFPSPGDLSDPGTEPKSLMSPAWAGGFFTWQPYHRVTDNRFCRVSGGVAPGLRTSARIYKLTRSADSWIPTRPTEQNLRGKAWKSTFLITSQTFLSHSKVWEPLPGDRTSENWFASSVNLQHGSCFHRLSIINLT